MAGMTGITRLRLAEASGPAKAELRPMLGFWDLVLRMIGTVIGSGIFQVPGAVLAQFRATRGCGMAHRAACHRHCVLGGSSLFDLAAPYGMCGEKGRDAREETYED